MLMPEDCVFCKIVAGAIPVKPIYQDEQLIAFADINPAAPVHALVIPRKHLSSLAAATAEDQQMLGHAMLTLPKIAELLGLAPGDCAVVEDAPAGLLAGLNAGCRTIAVNVPADAPRLDEADLVLTTLESLQVERLPDGNVNIILKD